MRLWVCGIVLTIIALAVALGKAETPGSKAITNNASVTSSGSADNCAAVPALMVARDLPEPTSVLLLTAGLISVALLSTIGRPPFRLKF